MAKKIEFDPSIWTVPEIWEGTAFIIGGGPSINQVNFNLIKEKRCIGVNNAYQLGDWIDICWFGDTRWYDWHRKKLKDFAGLKAHCTSLKKPFLKRVLRGKSQEDGKTRGIDERKRFVAWNRSSGASAINLAYHLGVSRVVLLGFDMRSIEVDGERRTNWHENHPSPHKNPYSRFLGVFPAIKRDADRLGFEILNATPGSVIQEFSFVDLKDVV